MTYIVGPADHSPDQNKEADDASTSQHDGNHLEVVLPVSLLHGISQIAVAKGMTLGEAINEAIAQYLERRKAIKGLD